MAGKEATVYVLDLGATMGEWNNGRVESDLDYGMRYIWDKIANTMAANRVTLTVGVVGFRTDETNNMLAADNEDEYANISVLKEMGPISIPDLKDLQEKSRPSETSDGDAVSAIAVAAQMLRKHTELKSGKPGKYKRKIVLLTDGQGLISDEDLALVAEGLNESGYDIELVVIGIDFDDADYGFKEEDKSLTKQSNEKILRDLVGLCKDGFVATGAEAIDSLDTPNVKVTKPYKTFTGQLKLGDSEKYPETTICIDVVRYFKTKAAPVPSASSFVPKVNQSASQGGTEISDVPSGSDLDVVRMMRAYTINDPEAVDGRRHIERDDPLLAKGYEYGRSIVAISSSEEDVTVYETKEGFEIIGFIPWHSFDRFLSMGESCITIAQQTNEKAVIALSSLIHALFELETYAIARLVTKENKPPQLLLLAPSITDEMESLIDVPLPFAEDFRLYRFAPLDRVITTSGVVLKVHRDIPKPDLIDAMGAYVDSMDLSSFGKDDEGEPTEYMPIEETYSPALHRINQAIRRRAVQPDEPVAPPAEILIKYSKPPEDLVKESTPKLKALIKAANVKKVEAKAKGKRTRRDQPAPLSGLNVEALLAAPSKRRKISDTNAVPDFKTMIRHIPADIDIKSQATEACLQLGALIHAHIQNSTGHSQYEPAYEKIGTMRAEMIDIDEPEVYNDFVRDLKERILKGEFGNRRDFFLPFGKKNLGLISKAEAPETSKVEVDEVKQFFRMSLDLPDRSK